MGARRRRGWRRIASAVRDVPSHLDDGDWFHGSPLELGTLAAGSTVTRCRVVAEAFAHKPTRVNIQEHSNGDTVLRVTVTHNGTLPGFLYVVDEATGGCDLHPHPHSSYPGGTLEWITDRPLRLRLVARLG